MKDWNSRKKYIEVLGHKMAYVEMGEGDPIVFQHGNPTSSYLWRNIMPKLADMGRCVAVDLIGMGDSDKLSPSGPDSYSFAEHSRYLDAAWQALDITQNVNLVIHDWGSALGFHWAHRHPDAIRSICYMEALTAPVPGWDNWPEPAQAIFQAMRSGAGEDIVLNKNIFVERILPSSILRDLSEEEMTAYRAPFQNPGEDRRPTLTWPRQIPINGEPENMVTLVQAYSDWLATSEIPKLFINGDPGSILIGAQRENCRRWANQQEITVKGLHFLQEDSPNEIAAALRRFLQDL